MGTKVRTVEFSIQKLRDEALAYAIEDSVWGSNTNTLCNAHVNDASARRIPVRTSVIRERVNVYVQERCA